MQRVAVWEMVQELTSAKQSVVIDFLDSKGNGTIDLLGTAEYNETDRIFPFSVKTLRPLSRLPPFSHGWSWLSICWSLKKTYRFFQSPSCMDFELLEKQWYIDNFKGVVWLYLGFISSVLWQHEVDARWVSLCTHHNSLRAVSNQTLDSSRGHTGNLTEVQAYFEKMQIFFTDTPPEETEIYTINELFGRGLNKWS